MHTPLLSRTPPSTTPTPHPSVGKKKVQIGKTPIERPRTSECSSRDRGRRHHRRLRRGWRSAGSSHRVHQARRTKRRSRLVHLLRIEVQNEGRSSSLDNGCYGFARGWVGGGGGGRGRGGRDGWRWQRAVLAEGLEIPCCPFDGIER